MVIETVGDDVKYNFDRSVMRRGLTQARNRLTALGSKRTAWETWMLEALNGYFKKTEQASDDGADRTQG